MYYMYSVEETFAKCLYNTNTHRHTNLKCLEIVPEALLSDIGTNCNLLMQDMLQAFRNKEVEHHGSPPTV